MHRHHNALGITANSLSLMRTQIERKTNEAVFSSLHGDKGGCLLRIYIRVHADKTCSYGVVEMITQTGWVPLWKLEGVSVQTRFYDVEDERPDFYFAEDMELLLQIGAEILTLSKAGGRF